MSSEVDSAGDSTRAMSYAGDELRLFADCVRWKRYFASALASYIGGDVLEVGAGIGGTTRILHTGSARSWTCLEPDESLARQIPAHITSTQARTVTVVAGDLGGVPRHRRFDTILYVDVLEHIEHDAAELERAAPLLSPGGHLVVLSPAYNCLYSEFDRVIGHYRRYTKRSLRGVFPKDDLRECRVLYLDLLGMLTSLANKYVLRQDYPTKRQLAIWDTWIVPVSRVLDPLLLHMAGRTIIAVYQKTGGVPTGRTIVEPSRP